MPYHVALCCREIRIAASNSPNVMPARILRLPIATQKPSNATAIEPARPRRSIPRPKLNITSAAWARLEKSSDRVKFLQVVREQIEAVAVKYLWLKKMEEEAEPLAAAKKILNKISKLGPLVRQLLPDLTAINSCETDAHALIRHKLSQHFHAPSRPPFGDHLSCFIPNLTAFADALNRIGSLETTDCQQYGNAWKGWIIDLTTIIRQAGLRTGVSKDSRCKDDSLFVYFVLALQKELPQDQFLQPFTDPRSLADAIYRARRSRPRAGAVKQTRSGK